MLSRRAIGLLLGSALAAAGCDRQTPPAGQANASATPDEVTADEVASVSAPAPIAGGIDRTHKGEAAPTLSFLDPAGAKTTLAAFRGRPVLVNLWATWCAPCIKELPSLDALAGAKGVAVLAISQDMDRTKVAPFLAGRKIANLQPYADPNMGLSLHYRVNLPTTILFDAQGREMWRVAGAFDWRGAEAKKLLAEG